MDGPYNTSPPPFNPAIEAWPGGPHPGAIAQMEAEKVAEAQAQREKRKRSKLLLLLRR